MGLFIVTEIECCDRIFFPYLSNIRLHTYFTLKAKCFGNLSSFFYTLIFQELKWAIFLAKFTMFLHKIKNDSVFL